MIHTITFISFFQIPRGCSSLHHEIELGVVIGNRGTDISEADAMSHVAGYILALDMTARDFQVSHLDLEQQLESNSIEKCIHYVFLFFICFQQILAEYSQEGWAAMGPCQGL